MELYEVNSWYGVYKTKDKKKIKVGYHQHKN